MYVLHTTWKHKNKKNYLENREWNPQKYQIWIKKKKSISFLLCRACVAIKKESKEAVARGNGALSPFATMCPGKRLLYFLGWGQLHYLLSLSQRSVVRSISVLDRKESKEHKAPGWQVAEWLLDWVNTSHRATWQRIKGKCKNCREKGAFHRTKSPVLLRFC